jgi:hypothetical protein
MDVYIFWLYVLKNFINLTYNPTAISGMKKLCKAKESCLLRYYAVLLGKEFPTFPDLSAFETSGTSLIFNINITCTNLTPHPLNSNISCLFQWVSNQHKCLLSNYCCLGIDN